MPDDRTLLAAYAAGDSTAAAELARRHFDLLYRFFVNKVDDDVEDLVHEALATLFRKAEEVRGEVRPFLLGTARNLVRRYYERRRTGAERIDWGVTSIRDLASSPSRVVARAQEQQRLLEALRALPLDHQILLELVYWEGLTGPELAGVLECPEGTIRTRLRRAKALLREALEQLPPPQDD